MIIAGRWVYRKYKKRQAAKEDLIESAHAKHGELVVATQEELSKTAVEDLGNAISKSQDSDCPPSYSRIEQQSPLSPRLMLHPSSSVKSATSSHSPPSLETHEQRETALSSLPRTRLPAPAQNSPSSLTLPVSPSSSELAAGQPTEIPVHGKWVWVPEESPLSTIQGPQGPQSTPYADVDDGIVAELPAVGVRSELPSHPIPRRASGEDETKSFVVAELEDTQLPADGLERKAR